MNFVKSMFKANRTKFSSRHSEAYSLKNLRDSSGYLRMTNAIAVFATISLLFSLISLVPKAQAAAPTNGLVGYWAFDEGSGTTAGDSSGNGNNGTLVNGPTWTAGKVGSQAISFDGSNDYIAVSNSTSLQVAGSGNSFAVSLWMNGPAAQSNTPFLIGTEASISIQRGWALMSNATNRRLTFFVHDGTTGYATGGAAGTEFNANAWTHVVLIVDRSTSLAEIWINGTRGDADSISGAGSFEKNAGVWVGVSEANTARAYTGSLDEVRIYNRALSAAETNQLYLMGK